MAYEVRITLGEWWRPEAPLIDEEAWRSVVAQDPDLELISQLVAESPTGEALEYSSRSLAMWTAHPAESSVAFDFRGGSVVVANPDEPVIDKMRQLARLLGGRVQGDEGEYYD